MTDERLFNAELIEHIEKDNVLEQLQSIPDFLRWGVTCFNQSDLYFGQGTDNPYDEMLHLVLASLHLPLQTPAELLNSRLTTMEKETLYQGVMTRLAYRTPMAYITNKAWFCGEEFYVDERVIVPRSPIGALIEEGFQGLVHEPKRILDLCTGSGCIAIACALAFEEAEVDAVDLSVDALNVAELNIARFGLTDRVFPLQSNAFDNLLAGDYDLIVTNPPYVDAEDLADMPVEFHSEPELALGSGHDGLLLTKQILAQSPQFLAEDGVLVCEVGNSMLALQAQFPEVPFEWLTLHNGGLGVFALRKADLVVHHDRFMQAWQAALKA